MKPFDLEAAKRGEPIVCRDGTPAKFIAHVPEAVSSAQVLVLIGRDVHLLRANGAEKSKSDGGNDLFMAPKKRTVWVNVYPDPGYTYYHNTQEAADARAGRDRVGGKAWPLEIEE